MSRINDQEYLRDDQYKDASNLNARIRIHVKFSINAYGWFPWVFDQFDLLDKARVLELGCGPGDMWLDNSGRIPDGWEITISDFSPGMLNKARERLADQSHPFTFEQIDAQSIPYEDDQFDIVIANHFLYHVPDRPTAILEIHRVLKPGGKLYATTVGVNHMKELPELVDKFDPVDGDFMSSEDIPFNMQNGADQLLAYFPKVEARFYEDALRITDADDLVDYTFSGMRLGLKEDRREEFTNFIQKEMAANGGVIEIQKESGIFMASYD